MEDSQITVMKFFRRLDEKNKAVSIIQKYWRYKLLKDKNFNDSLYIIDNNIKSFIKNSLIKNLMIKQMIISNKELN